MFPTFQKFITTHWELYTASLITLIPSLAGKEVAIRTLLKPPIQWQQYLVQRLESSLTWEMDKVAAIECNAYMDTLSHINLGSDIQAHLNSTLKAFMLTYSTSDDSLKESPILSFAYGKLLKYLARVSLTSAEAQHIWISICDASSCLSNQEPYWRSALDFAQFQSEIARGLSKERNCSSRELRRSEEEGDLNAMSILRNI